MLSNRAKEAVKASQAIQGKLADAFAKTIWSVQRWLEQEDNKTLQTETALKIISEETGLSMDEIIEPVSAK